MIRSYDRAAARVFDTPLLVHPGKAAAIVNGIGQRLLGGPVEVSGAAPVEHVAQAGRNMGRLGDPLERQYDDKEALFRVGPVAIIPVEGTLVHKGRWLGMDSGETSYEGIHRRVNAARRDPSVRGVVLEVDSYGGEVSGAFDCAEAIHELAMEKPVIAILTDDAFSAGYLLASASRGIILPPTGGVGSIGVVTLHADYSEMLEEAGIRVTIIAAGKHKAEGNPYEPLPDDVRDKWMSELEAMRTLFAETVGRFRGSRLDAAAALATEAECFIGEAAVAAGLADAVARPSEAFAAFFEEIQSGRQAA